MTIDIKQTKTLSTTFVHIYSLSWPVLFVSQTLAYKSSYTFNKWSVNVKNADFPGESMFLHAGIHKYIN